MIRLRTCRHFARKFALLLVTGIGLVVLSARADEPSRDPGPVELRARAKARYAVFHEHLLKTGDRSAKAEEMKRAIEGFDLAAQGFRSAGDNAQAALCQVEAADGCRQLEQKDEALRRYGEAVVAARQANSTEALAKAWYGQIGIHRRLTKDLVAADAAANQAILAARDLPDKTVLFNSLCVRCDNHLDRGEISAALEWIDRAFALRNQITDEEAIFFALSSRQDVYRRLFEKAEREHRYQTCVEMSEQCRRDAEEALAIAKKHGWDLAVGACQSFVFVARASCGLYRHYAEFVESKADSAAFEPKSPDDVFVAGPLFFKAITGRPPRDSALTRKALAEAGPTSNPLSGPAAFEEWVREHAKQFSQNDPAGAFVTALQMWEEQGDERGLEGFLRAIKLLEDDYRSVSDIGSSGYRFGEHIDFFELPIRLLLAESRYGEAFRLLEKSRARALTDMVMTREAIATGSRDRDLYEEIRRVRTDLTALKVSGQALSDREVQLQARYQELLEKTRKGAPRLLQLVAGEPDSLTEVEKAAAVGGYDILEYQVTQSNIFVWCIGKNGTQVRSVYLPGEVLRRKVEKLRSTLTNPKVTFDSTVARQLYLFLVHPLLLQAKSDHLVIIPHEALYDLPFQVLQDTEGRWLGQRFRISYAPSATLLSRLGPGQPLAGSSVLAVAGPKLREAKAEGRAIVGLYPDGSQLVVGADATKAFLQRNAQNYGVIHIAAHGEFSSLEPLRSFVQLWPAEPAEEGRLSAAEMFGLPLEKARLVTLSACETGRVSDVYSGEMAGLPRALIYAGAKAVLHSQWEVDSKATLAWMEAFYREARTWPLSEAARRASSQIEARPEYAHPYYWSAFCLIGR